MKKALTIFAASVALSIGLFVVIPVLDISSMLSVTIESDKPLSLQTGEVAGGKVEMTRQRRFVGGNVHLVLPNDVDLDYTPIGFSGGPCRFRIISMVYRKWCILPFKLDVSTFKKSYKSTQSAEIVSDASCLSEINLFENEGYILPTGMDGWKFDFGDRGFVIVAVVAIGIVMILFLMGLILGRKVESYKFNDFLIESATVSLTASVLFAVVLPLQIYIPSQHVFGFGMGELVRVIVTCASGMFVYFIAMLYLGRIGRFGRLPVYVLLLLSIAVHLENGVLAIGLPELDGNLMAFVNRSRSLWDLLVWTLILVGGLVFYPRLKSVIRWIALGLLVLVAASSLDIKAKDGDRSTAGPFADKTITHNQVLESAALSPKKNTVMFILDAVTTEVAQDVFSRDPELFARFDGFTFFTNNIGMHVCTELGVPGMFTGKYRSEFKSMGDYDRAPFGEYSAFKEYVHDNVGCFFDFGGFVHVNWTNRIREDRQSHKKDESNQIHPFKRRMNDQQAWNLLELCRFKAVPFVLKYYAYGLSFRSWPTIQMANEGAVYKKLRGMPLADDLPETLHVYHTEGAHAPYLIDKDGNIATGDRNCYEAVVEKGWFALSQLADLLDEFKKKGLYDNMFILIVADHGAALSKDNKSICVEGFSCTASRPHPLLFLKPQNCSGPPKIDGRMSSHSKIKELLMAVHRSNLSENDVAKIVETDTCIYQYEENGSFVNFVFHKDGTVSAEKVKVE